VSTLYLSAGFQRPALGLLVVLFFGGLAIAPVELALLAMGNLPEVASLPGLTKTAHQLYGRFWSILQWERECSRFDSELLYTFRPGHCVFENAEFRTAIEVNQLGLRDSEAALTRPEVAFLGDSYTAGWGINQEESFVELVETKTHLRTINVAAPSYGTPREFGLFSRIDSRAVRYIVLQYCPNDYEENLAFVESGFSRKIPNEEDWNAMTEWYSAHKRYYPGKYFAYAVQGAIRRALSPAAQIVRADPESERDPAPDTSSELHTLRLILEHFANILQGKHVFVISPGKLRPEPTLDGLDAELQDSERLRSCCLIETVALEDVLAHNDFFVLDPHLNARGHQKVAERLSELILDRERAQARPPGSAATEQSSESNRQRTR